MIVLNLFLIISNHSTSIFQPMDSMKSALKTLPFQPKSPIRSLPSSKCMKLGDAHPSCLHLNRPSSLTLNPLRWSLLNQPKHLTKMTHNNRNVTHHRATIATRPNHVLLLVLSTRTLPTSTATQSTRTHLRL